MTRSIENILFVLLALVLSAVASALVGALGVISWFGILALIFAIGLTLLCIHHQSVFPIFLVLIAVFPTERFDLLSVLGLPASGTFIPYLGILSAGLWVVIMVINRQKLVTGPEVFLVFMYLLVILVTALTGIDPDRSMVSSITFLQLCVLFIMIINIIDTPEKLITTLWVMVISTVIIVWSGTLALGQFGNVTRLESVSRDPNFAALQNSLILPLIMYLYTRSHNFFVRAVLILFFVATFVTILQTKSLTGLLVTLMGIALTIFFFTRRGMNRALLIILGIPILSIVILFMAPDDIQERITENWQQLTTFFEGDGDIVNFATYRGDTWTAALQAWRDYPILGVGAGNSPSVIYSYTRTFIKLRNRSTIHAHNMFLGNGVEFGVIGFLIFSGLTVGLILRMHRFMRHYVRGMGMDKDWLHIGYVILTSFIMFVVMGLSIEAHLIKYLWLLMGLSVAYRHISQQIISTKMT